MEQHRSILRTYQDTDASACIGILESNLPRYFSPQDLDDYLAFLDKLPGVYSVMEDDAGLVVGCGGIVTDKQGQEGTLTWGMIHAVRHRQGWGRRLTLARFLQLSLLPDVERITLNTSQETFLFYEQFGFRTLTFTPHGYSFGLHRYDMELVINEAFRQQLQEMMTKYHVQYLPPS